MTDPSPTPSAEQVIEDVLGRWMFARHGRVSSHVGADSFLHMLAEAGYSLVSQATDSDLRERVASRIHWAIGGWIMGPWEQVTHEGQRSVVYRAADAAIAAGVKDEEQHEDLRQMADEERREVEGEWLTMIEKLGGETVWHNERSACFSCTLTRFLGGLEGEQLTAEEEEAWRAVWTESVERMRQPGFAAESLARIHGIAKGRLAGESDDLSQTDPPEA